MYEARTATLNPAGGAWRWVALVLAWVAGIGVQLQQQALWPGAAYQVLLAAGLAGAWASLRARRRASSRALVLALAAAAVLGFAFAGWRADVRLSDALAPEWEGCDIELVGVVDEMPQLTEDGEQAAFVVESARALPMTAPQVKRLAALAAAAGSTRPAVAIAAPLAGRGEGEPNRLAATATPTAATRAMPPADDHRSGASAISSRADGMDGVADIGEADDASDAGPADDTFPTPAGASPRVPSRVWLAWGRNQRDDRAIAAAPVPLRAGQRWRIPVRLRLPHGAMNPDGFDAELWLFDQNLRATGVVRGNGVLLGQRWAPIENTRQWVRDRLLLAGAASPADAQAAGALAALAVGDQAAIDGAGWEVFRATGVAHLMSISGLHITMLAWLGGRAVGSLWRRSERAALCLPAPLAARWGGVLVAWLYALLAGWGVPAQRTVVMLGAGAALRGFGLNWPPTLVALTAMFPVTLLDPWALLQPGFWLSFAAVGLLMMSEPARVAVAVDRDQPPPARALGSPMTGHALAAATPRAAASAPLAVCRRAGRLLAAIATRALRALGAGLRGGARAQVVASIGLAPLTLVAFQQVSLVGLLANLVAEPWITLVVTPLTLLGIAAPPLWQLAALALRPLLWLLAGLSRWSFASVHVATAPAWALLAGLVGGAVLMLPIPWRVRLRGLPLLLPLLAPPVERPPPGRFALVAADVGQGTAVLVRTHDHLLLFDTGPRFGEGNDAGRRMLLPLLQARGESRIDVLVLSHADADHVGGAQSLIDRMPVASMRSSLDARNPLRANPLPHTPCASPQHWEWDGVAFRMLHPQLADYRRDAKTNALSCVLRIVDAEGRSALLTGDIEAPQEAALVARAAAALASDVLLVPHHGSHTSSTEAFLEAVHPQLAVIQVGYRSRYGHPAPGVVARYRAHRIPLVRTDQCGAWIWVGETAVCTRAVRRRYWSWQGTAQPPPPARIHFRSTAIRAGSDVAIESNGTPRGAAP